VKTVSNSAQCQGNSVLQCQEVTGYRHCTAAGSDTGHRQCTAAGSDTGYRHCTVARTLTVKTVDVSTVEFSLLLPTESLKLINFLADEDELNSSSVPQNQCA
jgi:hypothetical protein